MTSLSSRKRKLQEDDGDGDDDLAAKKKQRSPSKPKAAPPEKRFKRFRPTANSDTRSRINRALSQRMFLVNRQKISHELERFTVLGSTGNVYTVDIGRLVSCDCPDAAKGHLCKHHLFVMLRVLRVSPNNPSVWQTALLSSELLEIFNAAPPDPRLVAKTEVRAAWKKTVGLDSAEEEQEAETIDSEAGARDIEEGAECPTCYESLTDRTRATTHCITCRNSIHKDCLTTWKQACQSQHRPITCVYCRSDWVDVDQRNPSGAKAAANVSEGYLNFGRAVGLPQARDTSTYSSWPEW